MLGPKLITGVRKHPPYNVEFLIRSYINPLEACNPAFGFDSESLSRNLFSDLFLDR